MEFLLLRQRGARAGLRGIGMAQVAHRVDIIAATRAGESGPLARGTIALLPGSVSRLPQFFLVGKLQAKVGKATLVENRPVTLSIGVVTCAPGRPGITVDAMLEIADRLLYEVKSGGKSSARFATCDRWRGLHAGPALGKPI